MKFAKRFWGGFVEGLKARDPIFEYVLLLVVVVALAMVFKQRIIHIVTPHQCDVYNDIIIYDWDCKGRDPAGIR